MIEIFIVLIVAGVVWYLWKDYQITRNDKNIEYQVTDHSNNKGNIRESLSCLKELDNNGYKYFPIVGTSYRKLVSKDIGYFEGKAVAEKIISMIVLPWRYIMVVENMSVIYQETIT